MRGVILTDWFPRVVALHMYKSAFPDNWNALRKACRKKNPIKAISRVNRVDFNPEFTIYARSMTFVL